MMGIFPYIDYTNDGKLKHYLVGYLFVCVLIFVLIRKCFMNFDSCCIYQPGKLNVMNRLFVDDLLGFTPQPDVSVT